MENYLLTGLGIVVSILLFLAGYRQTIGAKKERIAIANAEIEKILVRRIVIEDFNLNIIVISRLIEGKARDFKVRISDLLSETQILNCIYTRIVETDFITQVQREEILTKIIPTIEDAEINEEREITEHKFNKQKSNSTQLLNIIYMAIFASSIGALISAILPYLFFTENIIDFKVPTITISSSLVLIGFISLLIELKEKQQEVSITSSSLALEKAIYFEKEVANVLHKKFKSVHASGPSDRGYDFIVDNGGRKILIEVKSWTKPVPNQIIESVARSLYGSVLAENATEGVIVTKVPMDSSLIDMNKYKVKIMSLSELKNS